MKNIWVDLLLTAGLCASVQADEIVYDLNTAGDFTTAFHTPYTGTLVSESSTGGLNNSGSVNFSSGGGNQGWFSDASYSPLETDGVLSDSLYFQYTPSSVSSIKLGFAADPDAAVNQYAMPISGSWAYFGIFGSADSVGSEVYSNDGYVGSTDIYTLIAGNWYQMQFGMRLLDASSSKFEFSWSLTDSTRDGVLGTVLMAGKSEKEFTDLNTTLYAYIGMENPTASASYSAIDNISLTSTASVPEPASAVLMFFGAAVGLSVYRKRHFAKDC